MLRNSIKFELEKNSSISITPCPHSKGEGGVVASVGSIYCQECEHLLSYSKKNSTVECSHSWDEKIYDSIKPTYELKEGKPIRRLLEVGETIERTDEIYDPDEREWQPVSTILVDLEVNEQVICREIRRSKGEQNA